MVPYEWTAHPIKDRPQHSFLIIAAACLFSGIILAAWNSMFLAFLAAVILVISVTPFWMPTHYRATKEGLHITRMGQSQMKYWSHIHRLDMGTYNAFLSPFTKKNLWLERYRGITVLFNQSDRDQVKTLLEHQIKPSICHPIH